MKLINLLLIVFLMGSVFAADVPTKLDPTTLPGYNDETSAEDVEPEIPKLSIDEVPKSEIDEPTIEKLTEDEIPESIVSVPDPIIEEESDIISKETTDIRETTNGVVEVKSNYLFYAVGLLVFLVIGLIGFLSRKTK